jgi:hypothetical protein
MIQLAQHDNLQSKRTDQDKENTKTQAYTPTASYPLEPLLLEALRFLRLPFFVCHAAEAYPLLAPALPLDEIWAYERHVLVLLPCGDRLETREHRSVDFHPPVHDELEDFAALATVDSGAIQHMSIP